MRIILFSKERKPQWMNVRSQGSSSGSTSGEVCDRDGTLHLSSTSVKRDQKHCPVLERKASEDHVNIKYNYETFY